MHSHYLPVGELPYEKVGDAEKPGGKKSTEWKLPNPLPT